ncbi:MAG TPA: hypothetical protein VEB19_02420, partial [Gemmatimonadaceae bacterium]|nr:hypothetical protein [Gemmatimonadaceae bacterium]
MAAARAGRNVFWNLMGGIWMAALTVAATPILVSRLGLDGYGIVGLWLALQGMLQLLDVGMGATVVRSFAARSGTESGAEFRQDLLRTLEVIYWIVAIALAVILAALVSRAVGRWVGTRSPAPGDSGDAFVFMALALSIQFPSLLYMSGLAGLQRHGRMNLLQMLTNTVRLGGGAAVVIWKPELRWFFLVQLVAALLQTFAARRLMTRSLLESEPRIAAPRFRIAMMRS